MSWVVFLHPIVLSVIFEANDKKIYSMVPKVSQEFKITLYIFF
jgi:hypothetical protein